MFGSLAPARRRLVLTLLVALVLVAGLVTAVAVRAGFGRAAVRPVAQQVAGPVLLLPGYGGSTTGLSVLAQRLRAAGKDVTVLELPDHAQGDLAGQAAVLGAAAKAALRRTGAPSVDVVGYSAGGVVARLWAKRYGGDRLARRVITLGSPQHGTALAALGSLLAGECPLACQQLISTSPVLAQLNTSPEVPAGPVFVSFWTSHDQVVLPPESAELTGALNIEIQDGVHGYDSGAGFLVLKDGPIKTIDDLKGKVIAVLTLGSATHMEVRAMLRKHNLEDKRDYSTIEAQFGNMKPLLLQGKADLISIAPPFSYDPELQAKSRMLFNPADSFGPIQITAWTARAEFLQKNRPALVDFMEDVIRSIRWYIDPKNHAEAVAIVAAYTKQRPEQIDFVFTPHEFYRDPNGEPDLDALQSNLDKQQNLGLLDYQLDIRKYADLSIVKEAAARLR